MISTGLSINIGRNVKGRNGQLLLKCESTTHIRGNNEANFLSNVALLS